MIPKGFKAGGIRCGISKKKGKLDLALFYSEIPCNAAGMFTSNVVKAAPVIVSKEHLRSKSKIRAVIANSGCANACTGTKGLQSAKKMCELTAKSLGIKAKEVLVASTGVIGQHLPMKNVEAGTKKIKAAIGVSDKYSLNAVKAIMTTDTAPKIASRRVCVGNKCFTVWGCVKGAGMIHPSLEKLHATMLGFILTDAGLSSLLLEKALNSAAEKSFNCVSVDGDTSTNDTLLILANGESGDLDTGEYKHFCLALDEVCVELAKRMAQDGEGATCLVGIDVKGVSNEKDAKKIARTIATSPLVKTAVFGRDANWGRIIAAAGRSGARFNPEKVDIYLDGLQVAENGMAIAFSEKKAKDILSKKEILITVNLNSGKATAKYYTCDFSFDYVKINASYRS